MQDKDDQKLQVALSKVYIKPKKTLEQEQDDIIAQADEAERVRKERDKRYGHKPMSNADINRAVKYYEKHGTFQRPIIDV